MRALAAIDIALTYLLGLLPASLTSLSCFVSYHGEELYTSSLNFVSMLQMQTLPKTLDQIHPPVALYHDHSSSLPSYFSAPFFNQTSICLELRLSFRFV